MMTRKERFMTTVKLAGMPDRVPMFDFLFQQPMYEALIGHKPGGYNAKDAIELAIKLDHDGVWIPVGGYNGFQPKYLSADTYVDEWGTTYRTTEYAWPIDAPVDYPIKSRDDWKRYVSPDPTLPGRADEVRHCHCHEGRYRDCSGRYWPVHHLLAPDGLRADLLRAVRRPGRC